MLQYGDYVWSQGSLDAVVTEVGPCRFTVALHPTLLQCGAPHFAPAAVRAVGEHGSAPC